MIIFEPFERNDFERLISWVDNEEILIQFGGSMFSFPLTIEQLEHYKDDKKRLAFKVIEQTGRTVIGHAELFPADNNQSIRICRVLIGDETKRRRGFGQQIVKELLKIAFLKLDKQNAELNVFDWNTNAIKCYEKVGFIINPNKASKLEVRGNIWTAINMTIDRAHWNINIAD